MFFLITNNPAVAFCSSSLGQKLVGFQLFPAIEKPSGPMDEPRSLALSPSCQSFCCTVVLGDTSNHEPLENSGQFQHLHCHTRCHCVGINTSLTFTLCMF